MHRPGAFEMLGVVPDIEEAYAKTWIAVNPVHAGTGLAIKSIEALGFAIPLVTTRTGARGLLDTGSAGFLCIPDHDAEAMAAAIVSLLCNEAARTRLSLEAWEYSRRWNERALQAVRSILHAGAKLGARSHEGQELR
jgi:glycosyltransferase involved in cell wall biosynthesis